MFLGRDEVIVISCRILSLDGGQSMSRMAGEGGGDGRLVQSLVLSKKMMTRMGGGGLAVTARVG